MRKRERREENKKIKKEKKKKKKKVEREAVSGSKSVISFCACGGYDIFQGFFRFPSALSLSLFHSPISTTTIILVCPTSSRQPAEKVAGLLSLSLSLSLFSSWSSFSTSCYCCCWAAWPKTRGCLSLLGRHADERFSPSRDREGCKLKSSPFYPFLISPDGSQLPRCVWQP